MLPDTPRPPARSRLRLSKALPTPPQLPGNPKEQEILSTANSTPLASPATVRAMLAVTADQVKLVGLSSNPRKTSDESPSIEADIPELRTSTGSSESESDSPSTPNPPPASYLDQPLPKLPMGLPAISNLIDDKSSSTQQELWRRREEKKTKTSTAGQKTSFWNLGLRKSNGSTAQAKEPSPTATSNLPPKPPPRTLSARKPVPVRPAPPQPDNSMGNQISKMKERKSNSSTTSKDEVLPTFSTFKRLPTPDQLPKPPPSQPQSQPPRTSSLPQHSTKPPQDEELTPKNPPASSNSRSSTPLTNTTNRPPPPGTFPSSHTRDSSSATITSSSSQHAPALEAPQPSHPFTMRLLTPPPPPTTTTSSSSSTTLVSTSAHAHAHASSHSKGHIRFPSSSTPLPAHDAILAAPPLGPLHWSCYQKHRYMRRGRNEVCAVACMVCQVRDRECRWRCPWCCLSACAACMESLAEVPGRELRGVMERVGGGAVEGQILVRGLGSTTTYPI